MSNTKSLFHIVNNLNFQDAYYSKGNSWSASLGIGIGTGDMGKALGNGTGKSNAGNNSGSIGFNVGSDKTDSAWVNNQTSLTGNNVAINVGTKEGSEGKTTITGAIIAAGSYDKDGNFNDSGNLALNTKDLTYSNIKDFYKTESKGFGLSTGGGTTSNAGESNLAPKGSTTMSVKSTGEEREQSTKAAVGSGTITTGVESYTKEVDENGNETGRLVAIGGTVQTELAGLNRDVNKSQEITKDMITGALDGSMTIDNRILMGLMSTGKTQATDKDGKPIVDKDGNPVMRDVSGFESVANDFINLRTNASKAVAGAFSTAVSPFTAIYSSLTSTANDTSKGENAQNDKKDIITAWKANQSNNATGILRGGNEDLSKIVDKAKKGEASPQELQYLASMAADGKGNLLFSSDGQLVNKQTGEVVLGFNDVKNNQGYVDASKTATNVLQFYLTDAEERAHNYTSNETIAKSAAKSELGYFNAVSWLSGTSTISTNTTGYGNTGGVGTNGQITQSQMDWNKQYNASNNALLRQNAQQASLVSQNDMAFRTYYARGTSFGEPATDEDKIQDLKTGQKIATALNDDGEVKLVEWTGENVVDARKEGAEWILEDLKLNPLAEGEQLNLIGFSHGGNVVNYATWLDLGYNIDNLVYLATPQTSRVQPNYNSMSGNGYIYNFYGVNDKVQDWIGGTNGQVSIIPPSAYGFNLPKNPSQTLTGPNVINIRVNQNPIRNAVLDTMNFISPGSSVGWNLLFMQNTHTNMHSDKTVDKYVVPAITNNNGK